VAAVLASPAAGDEPLRLQEITVEASPIDPYLPARTEVERSAIVDTHKSELSDVLELTPGINVREGGRGEVRVDMRGFDQRATLFTLNGVPVYEPYNGIINVNLFPLEMLGGVAITRGASSSLYGPNGMAGQIKLNTFGPHAPLSGSVSTIWRDADLWDVRASAGATHDHLSAFAAGRYLTSPNFTLAGGFDDRPAEQRRGEDGGKRLNSDVEQLSGFATVGYEYGVAGRAHVAVLASDASFGIPPSTTQFAPMFLRNEPQRLLHVQAGVDQRVSPTVGVAGGLFYTGYDNRELQYSGPDFQTLWLTTNTNSSELGGIGRVTIDVGDRDSLAVGGQVRGDSADVSNSVRGTISRPDFTIASIAIENVYAATDRINLVFGSSYDLLTGDGTTGEFNPQGIISTDFGLWGATRLAVGRKIRFPTLRELFDPVQGNPDLAPESALTYEIGHYVSRTWGYGTLNLFRSDVHDLIASSGDMGEFMNVQRATLQGVEVACGLMPLAQVRLELNYTYLDATGHDAVTLGAGSSAIQHKPAHRFNGVLQVLLPWQFSFRTEGLYTSEQLDQFGSQVVVGGFGLWNVQLTRPVGEWLSLFAGTDNLLDTDYEQKLGDPQSGRRAFAGFRATY
jgi:vitamin B12 transporter